MGIGFAEPAYAGHPADCRVSGAQSEIAFPLRHVQQAIADKKLSVLVVGAGSSQLPGPNGAQYSYPARLQQALSRLLPGVDVKVAADVKSKRTAIDMVKTLPASLSNARPALMVWQTATVDAMQGVDPDQFSQALDKGSHLARDAGSDVIIMNPQYSPRTDSIIALGTYVENMRWVAVQQEVPVFDRFGLMKAWYEQGTFDLYSATKKLDMAELVHDCIGRLLADLVIEAAKPDPPSIEKGK
ncbi:MAG: SGNH/GDSL hydrolase family protein [Pseudolabrys sp.]|jgi:hypothetical protein